MLDFYLADRSRLNERPKRTIGDYVASQGILVPRRFDSLAEARASGLPIICRSEHPQEYDGVSGLLHSPQLKEFPHPQTESELVREILNSDDGKDNRKIHHYILWNGPGEKPFVSELHYSFWECVDGCNVAVIQDSAISERYHVMVNSKKFSFNDYFIVEGDNIPSLTATKYDKKKRIRESFKKNIPLLIKMYEQVRHLDHFDPNHCPIMEFQSRRGEKGWENYFLQYHRTRDFSPSPFKLDRLPEGYTPAFFCRGFTSPEGRGFRVKVKHADTERMVSSYEWRLKEEEAAFYFQPFSVFTEIMAHRWKLYLRDTHELAYGLTDVIKHHVNKSAIFKPETSLILPKGIISASESTQLFEKAYATGEDQYVNLKVISDGRIAGVKRI